MVEVEVEAVDNSCSSFLGLEFNCKSEVCVMMPILFIKNLTFIDSKISGIFECGSFFLGTVGGKYKTQQTNGCKDRSVLVISILVERFIRKLHRVTTTNKTA